MNKFMKIAIDEAKIGIKNGDGGPFGCCIVLDGKVIGKGHNSVLKNNDCTCHGEMEAIRDACKNMNSKHLSGAVLYTTGEPCPMCKGAIQWARIEKIYYGCSVQDNSAIGFDDKSFYANNCYEAEQLDKDECKKVFDKFNKIKNKTIY